MIVVKGTGLSIAGAEHAARASAALARAACSGDFVHHWYAAFLRRRPAPLRPRHRPLGHAARPGAGLLPAPGADALRELRRRLPAAAPAVAATLSPRLRLLPLGRRPRRRNRRRPARA